jgi:predicted ABC-type transport system involved in lysophospholipase L1 biosynthesis ATPase subunit
VNDCERVDHPVLQLSGVRREFDEGRIVALAGVSLSIARGETVAIVGRSGSGKSTLVNMLCGLDLPSAGEVRVLGQAVSRRAEWTELRARHFGIVFQQFHLLPTLSAVENVELALMPAVSARAARRARSRELLENLGLGHRLDLVPARLSGGERQRVAIARALANSPEILIADEPTGSLDRQSADNVLAMLLDARARVGSALVIVTHERSVALACEREVTLVDGTISSDVQREPAEIAATGVRA